MNYDEIINNIRSFQIKVTSGFQEYCNESYRWITNPGEGAIYVKSENYDNWNNLTDILVEEVNKSDRNMSERSIHHEIMMLLCKNDTIKWSQVKNHFNTMSLKEFYFIRPMYNVSLGERDDFKIGKISFINVKNIEASYKARCDVALDIIDESTKESNEIAVPIGCYIEVIVKAKEFDRAREYANDFYRRIESVFRLLLKKNNDPQLRFGINNITMNFEKRYYGFSEGGMSYYYDNKPQIIILDNEIFNFFFERDFTNYLWEIIQLETINPVQERIVDAVVWYGMATHESNDDISIVQCFFAIERLLVFNNELLTKSITAQISEVIAFLTGTDIEKRIMIERQVKRLYKLRSSIVHGGIKKGGYTKEKNELFKLTQNLILKFLNMPFIDTMDKFNNLILRLRYKI